MTEHPYSRTEGDLRYAITQDALDGAAASGIVGVVVADHRLLRPRRRGAVVTIAADQLSVRLELACRYGTLLPDAALAVQRAVATALGRLTGLAVAAVDVEIVAVTRP